MDFFLFFFFQIITDRYESKRLEIEAWLARMETRSEHMGPVGTTADILEAQQKEQKVREYSK